jgi:glycosyltransferase involved in cell wall biosynthesis
LFEKIYILPIRHDVRSFGRRLALLPRYPSHVASRVPDAGTVRRLMAEAEAFAPAGVVNDGIYGAALGRQVAKRCQVPAILRGHNVEHVYFAQQARAARGLKHKLAWSIARLGLERWERSVVTDAAWSFHISADDVDYWRSQGMAKASWAPTTYPGPQSGTLIPPDQRQFDIAYIGNMRLPNNIQGLHWFVEAVLPRLRQLRAGLRLCFAGANPTDAVRDLFARTPDIDVVFNAPSADAILSQSRVLVNPILSGSGVNVKSIDMLRYDAPIVTTPVGVQGFPTKMRSQFVVRSDAQAFAEALVAAVDDPVPPPDRAAIRATFGQTGMEEQIAAYARICGIAAAH